jgi:hypothetical protein
MSRYYSERAIREVVWLVAGGHERGLYRRCVAVSFLLTSHRKSCYLPVGTPQEVR